MRYFGPRWDAPICDDGDHVMTPTGEECEVCERPIQAGQQGVVLAYYKGHVGGVDKWDDFPVHLNCLVTSVTGKETP